MMRLLPCGLIGLVLALVAHPRVCRGDVEFIRGDVNGDGRVTISDAIRLVLWLDNDYDPPPCRDAADVDDNGVIDSVDVDYLLQSWDLGGRPIPPPFPEPGPDPTPDDLTCDR